MSAQLNFFCVFNKHLYISYIYVYMCGCNEVQVAYKYVCVGVGVITYMCVGQSECECVHVCMLVSARVCQHCLVVSKLNSCWQWSLTN